MAGSEQPLKTSFAGRAAQRLPALSGDAPDFASKTFGIDRLDRVENAPIMNRPPADHVQVYVLWSRLSMAAST
jgi:hypothetical protein